MDWKQHETIGSGIDFDFALVEKIARHSLPELVRDVPKTSRVCSSKLQHHFHSF